MMAERFARGFSPGGELSERCASRAALAPERGEVKCDEARAERGVLRGVSPRIEPQRRVELVRAPVEICMTRSRPSGDMGVTAGTDLRSWGPSPPHRLRSSCWSKGVHA